MCRQRPLHAGSGGAEPGGGWRPGPTAPVTAPLNLAPLPLPGETQQAPAPLRDGARLSPHRRSRTHHGPRGPISHPPRVTAITFQVPPGAQQPPPAGPGPWPAGTEAQVTGVHQGERSPCSRAASPGDLFPGAGSAGGAAEGRCTSREEVRARQRLEVPRPAASPWGLLWLRRSGFPGFQASEAPPPPRAPARSWARGVLPALPVCGTWALGSPVLRLPLEVCGIFWRPGALGAPCDSGHCWPPWVRHPVCRPPHSSFILL